MNAPDRIWASGFDAQPAGRWWHETELTCGALYIRADLVPQWQPIETAPKDGTKILGAWPQLRKHKWWTIQPIFFYCGNWIHGWDEDEDLALHPTHWMPLPEPPKKI